MLKQVDAGHIRPENQRQAAGPFWRKSRLLLLRVHLPSGMDVVADGSVDRRSYPTDAAMLTLTADGACHTASASPGLSLLRWLAQTACSHRVYSQNVETASIGKCGNPTLHLPPSAGECP